MSESCQSVKRENESCTTQVEVGKTFEGINVERRSRWVCDSEDIVVPRSKTSTRRAGCCATPCEC